VTEEIFPTDLFVLELYGINPSYIEQPLRRHSGLFLEFEDNLNKSDGLIYIKPPTNVSHMFRSNSLPYSLLLALIDGKYRRIGISERIPQSIYSSSLP
jgi:hypothetical protein